jgi:hypothetical protein
MALLRHGGSGSRGSSAATNEGQRLWCRIGTREIARQARTVGSPPVTLHRTLVDDIPTFWVDGRPPLSAALVFGAGVSDETFTTVGVTHLVEHLVMSTIGRRHHDYNASVDARRTMFTATGSPEAVGSFLVDVCTALHALPLDRIGTEASVLAAEGGLAMEPPVGEHLRRRFGLHGLGLLGVSPPALREIGPDLVSEHVRSRFVSGNAALALTGPPPAGLRLDVPAGARPARTEHDPLEQPYPQWGQQGGPGFALSFRCFGDIEARLAVLRIALDRAVDTLRHDNGWLYHLDFSAGAESRGIACFYGDSPDEHVDACWRGLRDILERLRDEGPTDEELADDFEGMRQHLADPRATEGIVLEAASEYLAGEEVRSPETKLRARELVTRGDCQAALQDLADSLLVTVPEDVTVEDPGLQREPEWSDHVVVGERFGRSLRSPLPWRGHVVVGDDGVSVVLPDGPVTVRWADLVGCGIDDDGVRTLIGVDGMPLPLHAKWLRGGQRAMALIEARTPERLRFRER